ncbi:hypothetical protein BJ508DRAFT_374940 [Ascobolus immersus RN42]|uniref:Uncharacterized protein n=1 Tax=Ascobolus immersus RN42 TaxID=1160509 RepID=A0A3N4IHM8_ASCIM|nr:hypothetical protein BJ508DRAFT_374940 [Ascobolus immersus RN42]
MDFAPYQSAAPETRRSLDGTRPTSPPIRSIRSPPSSPPLLPVYGNNDGITGGPRWGGDVERGTGGLVNEFETSLPVRLDFEAMAAYLLLPPIGGVILLILEHKSDYIRFHAWQSSLLFTAIIVVHFVLFWSSFLQFFVMLGYFGAAGYLAYRAYKDADNLDRAEMPFFGPLATRILDDE